MWSRAGRNTLGPCRSASTLNAWTLRPAASGWSPSRVDVPPHRRHRAPLRGLARPAARPVRGGRAGPRTMWPAAAEAAGVARLLATGSRIAYVKLPARGRAGAADPGGGRARRPRRGRHGRRRRLLRPAGRRRLRRLGVRPGRHRPLLPAGRPAPLRHCPGGRRPGGHPRAHRRRPDGADRALLGGQVAASYLAAHPTHVARVVFSWAAHAFAGGAEMDARLDRVYNQTRPALHCRGAPAGPALHGLGFYSYQFPQSAAARPWADPRPPAGRPGHPGPGRQGRLATTCRGPPAWPTGGPCPTPSWSTCARPGTTPTRTSRPPTKARREGAVPGPPWAHAGMSRTTGRLRHPQ